MIGRMSAAGKLGTHRYPGHERQDWTRRTYHVSADIQPEKQVSQKRTIANLELLKLKAINQPKTKLRPVLHIGLYKYQPADFDMPIDIKQVKADRKKAEREGRLSKFAKDIDEVVL